MLNASMNSQAKKVVEVTNKVDLSMQIKPAAQAN
jgi:hypothetical protein